MGLLMTEIVLSRINHRAHREIFNSHNDSDFSYGLPLCALFYSFISFSASFTS